MRLKIRYREYIQVYTYIQVITNLRYIHHSQNGIWNKITLLNIKYSIGLWIKVIPDFQRVNYNLWMLKLHLRS